MILVATDHWTLEGRVEEALLELVRTRREFECALDVEVEADAIAGIAHSFEAKHGIVFDVRNGPGDDRPQLEAAMRRFIGVVAQPFERVAILVSTHAAMHRMARIARDLPEKPLITLNAAQAESHARGMKATGERVGPGRADTSWARPKALPAHPDQPRRELPFTRDEDLVATSPPPPDPPAPKGRGRRSSLSGEELASAFVIEQLADEVVTLAAEIESWAMVREKVIDKLDIRGARAARATARELRGALAILKSSQRDRSASAALYAEIQELVERGRSLLGVARSKAPTAGAKSLRPHQPRESPPPARRSRNPNRRSVPSAATSMSRATRRPR